MDLGKTMGGFGSGGHNSTGRGTTNVAPCLDVNTLYRKSVLTDGWIGGWNWQRDGETFANIGIHGGRDYIRLIYNRDGQPKNETITVFWQPCHFGGHRPLFICPDCGHRAMKTFLYGPRFRCRKCANLVYASQRESGVDRPLRRSWRLRAKLGGEPGMQNPIPDKPKQMHWKTYYRIVADIGKAEIIANDYSLRLCERLMGNYHKSNKKGFWS